MNYYLFFAFDLSDSPPGVENYWGYSPINWFTPHNRYVVGDNPLTARKQVRDLVAACHDKGIEVILDVVDAENTETYDEAPVDILVTSEVSKNVLYVPVNALVALAEGGYAVEVLVGENKEYIAVEIGVFTDGFVEIIGNVQEGQEVIVPR